VPDTLLQVGNATALAASSTSMQIGKNPFFNMYQKGVEGFKRDRSF
jgi:hypothetical protein